MTDSVDDLGTVGTAGPADDRSVSRRRSLRLPIGAVIGLILLAIVLLVTFVGPYLWTASPQTQDLRNAFAPMSGAHPLGTDNLGRDLLARVIAGGRVSMSIGFLGALLGMVAGTLVGLSAALLGRATEAVLMRLVDALLAVPDIVLALILISVVSTGAYWSLIGALAIASLPVFARMSFTLTRRVARQDYFFAAKLLGAPMVWVTMRHVLPNMAGTIVVIGTMQMGSNVLIAGALSFFGLGIQPPTVDWGLMISDGAQYSFLSPLMILAPGIALFLTSVGCNLLGDGLQDVLDPQGQAGRK